MRKISRISSKIRVSRSNTGPPDDEIEKDLLNKNMISLKKLNLSEDNKPKSLFPNRIKLLNRFSHLIFEICA